MYLYKDHYENAVLKPVLSCLPDYCIFLCMFSFSSVVMYVYFYWCIYLIFNFLFVGKLHLVNYFICSYIHWIRNRPLEWFHISDWLIDFKQGWFHILVDFKITHQTIYGKLWCDFTVHVIMRCCINFLYFKCVDQKDK